MVCVVRQGKMHSTIEERYADGYAFNSVTKRYDMDILLHPEHIASLKLTHD